MQRLGLKATADWCRAVGSPLRAGLSIKEAVALAAKQRDPEIGVFSASLWNRLEEGATLAEAMDDVRPRPPALLLAMAKVGERTGRFPEALRELEKYYRFQLTLRREFVSQMTYPVMQLLAAIGIIGLMIYVMGFVGGEDPRTGKKMDMLGFGLSGGTGALIWFGLCFGTVFAVGGLAYTLRRGAATQRQFDGWLMRVPALGPCLQTLAMTRLCMAMGMTMDSALSPKKSLPLALSATDNGVYTNLAEPIVAAIGKKGTGIADAFDEHRSVFPDEFLGVLRTGEETGTIPEDMARLAEHFREQTEHRMRALNQAVGWAVWATVAGLIIFVIFRIFSKYVGMINEFAK